MPDRARYDVNNQASLMAVSSVDGAAPVDLWADPSTHALAIAGSLSITPSVSTPYKLNSAATTNATSVKGSAGKVYNIEVFNTSSVVAAYVKFYDKATAPTVGSDTPVKVIAIPAAANSVGVTGAISAGPIGRTFSDGIAIAITGGIADADTTAVALNQVLVNLDYA